METMVKLLQSHSGRDKTMRTVGYVAMMLSGAADGKTAKNLGTVSSQISAARVVTRLFDDIPMWAHALKFGTGSHEKDPITRLLSLTSNVANVIFFPTEHIAWAAEHKMININAAPWWKAGVICWAISLLTGILKGLRTISILRYKRAKILKQKKLESPDKGDASSDTFKSSMMDLARQEQMEYLLLIKNGTDFLNAVNWLPAGILWSGRFNTTQCGVFGTIASLVGLLVLLKSQ